MSTPKATFAPNNKTGSQPIVSPDFASDEAAEAWIEAGRPRLEGEPSGKTGYTKADVLAAAEEE